MPNPPPAPKIIQTTEDFRRQVLAKEQDTMVLMVNRWGRIENALEAQIEALALKIDALRREGIEPTDGMLYQMDRYHALLGQAQVEVRKYEQWAGRIIEQNQQEYFNLGRTYSLTAMGDLVPPGINFSFNRIPKDAVNNMIGVTADGSPLFSVLQKRALYPEAVDGLTTNLINAMAQGWNPKKTARAMRDGLSQGLDKALVIARTEQLRAYREATLQNYKANTDIVLGFIWLAACDSRTCCGCFSMHNTKHSLDEQLSDHVCGRCSFAPWLKSWSDLGYSGIPDSNPTIPSGEDMFAKLTEEQQRATMGNRRYELYKSGQLAFKDMASFKDDPIWGRSVRITPLGDLGKKSTISISGLPNKLKLVIDPDDPERYIMPLPKIDSELKSIARDYLSSLTREEKDKLGTIQSIPINELFSGQNTVKIETIEYFLSGGKPGVLEENIVVADVRGKYYLMNGNHRVVAALLKGDKNILAKVINIP